MGIANKEDILFADYRILPYGNIVFKEETVKISKRLTDWFRTMGSLLSEDLENGNISGPIRHFCPDTTLPKNKLQMVKRNESCYSRRWTGHSDFRRVPVSP